MEGVDDGTSEYFPSQAPLHEDRPATRTSMSKGIVSRAIDGLLGFVLPSPRSNFYGDESADEMDELLDVDVTNRVSSLDAEQTLAYSSAHRPTFINLFNHHVLFSVYGFNVDTNATSIYHNSEWERLPQEILLAIFSFLPFESLIISTSQVSKEWFYLSQKNILWEKFFIQQLFPKKHSKFLFSSFETTKNVPEIEGKENLVDAIQNRFYVSLFDPNPTAANNENNEEDIEEHTRSYIKRKIEHEITEDLDQKFSEFNVDIKSIVNRTHMEASTEDEDGFTHLLHAPYICSFFKLCYQRLNNFVSTATRKLESHQKHTEKLEFIEDMCHNTQYLFTFYAAVPVSALSVTICLALQLVKMNVPYFSIDTNDPNAVDVWWSVPFTFLYLPFFCGIIVLCQQLAKNYLKFILRKRQTVQGIFVTLIGLIFVLGLLGFFFMVNLSCMFPLHPKYLSDDSNVTQRISFYEFRKVVNNYMVVMSPFLISFLLMIIVSLISQLITLFTMFNGTRRQLMLRTFGTVAVHLFFVGLVVFSFGLLYFAQEADATEDEGLTGAISIILIVMHVIIGIMHVLTGVMFGLLVRRFCTFLTPLAKQPMMKRYGMALVVCVALLLVSSMGVEVMISINYKLFAAPALPAPLLSTISFYLISAMYRLWMS